MPDETAPTRPKLREIVSAAELEGMATDAGMSDADLGKLLGPLVGVSAGVGQLAAAAGDALTKQWGFKYERAKQLALACAYPVAVKALVFALSSQRFGITTAFDTPRGAYLEAKLPADIWSISGTLEFDLVEEGSAAVMLSGVSEVGQAWDWGKGERALNGVLEKIEDFARRLGG